jgi:hypothetical protein
VFGIAMKRRLHPERKLALPVAVLVLLASVGNAQNGDHRRLVLSAPVSEANCQEFPVGNFDIEPSMDRSDSGDRLNVRCGSIARGVPELTLTFTFDDSTSGPKGPQGQVFRFHWSRPVVAASTALTGQFTRNPDLCSRLARLLNSKTFRLLPVYSTTVHRVPEMSATCNPDDFWGLSMEIELTADFVGSTLIDPVRTQQTEVLDYVLDGDGVRWIALYPAPAYRSYVEPKYVVQSLEELERRVGQLPPGTKLNWNPYKRDSSGKPFLFSDGQYDHFAKFCNDHKIELLGLHSKANGKSVR